MKTHLKIKKVQYYYILLFLNIDNVFGVFTSILGFKNIIKKFIGILNRQELTFQALRR